MWSCSASKQTGINWPGRMTLQATIVFLPKLTLFSRIRVLARWWKWNNTRVSKKIGVCEKVKFWHSSQKFTASSVLGSTQVTLQILMAIHKSIVFSSTASQNNSGLHYFILLIITDGAITDMDKTKTAIVQVCLHFARVFEGSENSSLRIQSKTLKRNSWSRSIES